MNYLKRNTVDLVLLDMIMATKKAEESTSPVLSAVLLFPSTALCVFCPL
jgi:hypothetical protein